MKKYVSPLLFSLCMLSSCFGGKSSTSAAPELVPPDFGTGKFTLLVNEPDTRAEKKVLKRCFDKYYKGAYVLVQKVELKSLYGDVNKFPFVFGIIGNINSSMGRMGSTNYVGSTMHYSIIVTDRKSARDFGERDVSAVAAERHIANLLIKLEAARMK